MWKIGLLVVTVFLLSRHVDPEWLLAQRDLVNALALSLLIQPWVVRQISD